MRVCKTTFFRNYDRKNTHTHTHAHAAHEFSYSERARIVKDRHIFRMF